jgi:tetratricopeptide (TPR) repeat protein
VGIYLTYFSVRTARATYYTGLETLYGYERATQTEPENPRNWYLLGRYLQYSLEDANPQRSISSYLTSLRLDPQATVTWLDLAATYETEGNDAEARSAFLNAKKTYPASAEVSWRYGNFLLRQGGELEAAFAEIRHSVETDPLRAPEAFSRSVRIEPNADVILDRVIPANREVYIAVMHDLIGDRQVDKALKVWKRLLAMHAEVPMSEIFGLVSTLRQMGRGPEAHELWMQGAERAGLGELQGPKDSAVWDGGFESTVSGWDYSWRYSTAAHGVQSGTDRQEQHSGKQSLRVSFDGSSDISFREVCQTVPVKGGTSYELSGWMQSKELTTDKGVRLELQPFTSGGSLVNTAEVHGTEPWTRVAAVWDGSKENQDVEICLRRDASDQEDNKIRGTVWVDDVALTPTAKIGDKK